MSNVPLIFDNMENLQQVELEFKRQLQEQHDSKKHNSVLIPKTEYFALIEELKIAGNAEPKSRKQYHILSRYVTNIIIKIIFNYITGFILVP